MDKKNLIQYDISVIDKYLKEHGQKIGSVSWQMVEQSFNHICEHIRELSNEIIELRKIIADRDEQSI